MIVMKQWKKPKTIYRNLSYLNRKNRNGFSQEDIHKVANSRLGWYRRSGMNVVNFIISKDLPENRIKDGAGLLNPLSYYFERRIRDPYVRFNGRGEIIILPLPYYPEAVFPMSAKSATIQS